MFALLPSDTYTPDRFLTDQFVFNNYLMLMMTGSFQVGEEDAALVVSIKSWWKNGNILLAPSSSDLKLSHIPYVLNKGAVTTILLNSKPK